MTYVIFWRTGDSRNDQFQSLTMVRLFPHPTPARIRCFERSDSLVVQRSSLLLATVVLLCCISVAQGESCRQTKTCKRPKVSLVEGTSEISFPRRKVNELAGKTAGGRRLLQHRQDTRSQEMLKNTQEQSSASIMMSPEAVLVEVSEERPHLAGVFHPSFVGCADIYFCHTRLAG